jgi:outer membrane protein TolC
MMHNKSAHLWFAQKQWVMLLGFILVAHTAVFCQLTLEEAIQTGIENNFQIRVEKNNQRSNVILNNWGTAGLWPSVSINSTIGIASNSLEQELANGTLIKRNGAILRNSNAGLLISWRIFDGMRMFATKKRLEELERNGELNFRRQINSTVFDIIGAFYLILQLEQQQKAIRQTIRFFEERKKIAEDRFRIGTAAKTDLLQAQTDLNVQQSNLYNVKNSLQQSYTDLNHLMGRDPAHTYTIQGTIQPDTTLTIASVKEKILAGNFDLLMAQSQLSILFQNKREIISQRLPVVTLNGNFNFNQNRNDAGFTLFSRNSGPNGNIGIAIPLFNGGNIARQQQVSEVAIQSQQITIERLQNQLYRDALNSFSLYKNGLALAALETQTLQLIEENNMIAAERFKKMAITSIEWRQIQLDMIQSQTRYLNALFTAKIAEAELKLLAGVLVN